MRELEQLGDSVLVVGDPTTLKVHVHTDDPDAATALFDGAGVVSHLDVADMRAQVQERDARLQSLDGRPALCGALAVVTGAGMRALFESFGVRTLDGGPTLNPSTYELLAAIHAVDAEEVVVLPNSPNVVMAAERAADAVGQDRRGRALPLAPGGAGGGGEPRPGPRPRSERARRWRRRSSGCAPARSPRPRATTRAAASARATRSGFVEDEIVVWGRPRDALRGRARAARDRRRADHLPSRRRCAAGRRDGQALAQGDVEFELSDGGQKSYWWLLVG